MTTNTLASRILSVLTLRELDILARRDPALAGLMEVPVEEFAAALLDEPPRRGRAARRPLRRPLAPRTTHGPAPEAPPPEPAPPQEVLQEEARRPAPEPREVPALVREEAASPTAAVEPQCAPTAAEGLAMAESAFARGDYPAATRLCGAHLESYFRPCASGGRAGAALLLKALRLRVEPPAAPLGEEVPAAEAAPTHSPARAKPCVILVGGLGRMADEYERLFEGEGCDLIFVENTPRGLKGAPRASGIIVVTSNVSHPLREMAVEVAARVDCPIHYIDRPSLSGIRKELRAILGKAGAP